MISFFIFSFSDYKNDFDRFCSLLSPEEREEGSLRKDYEKFVIARGVLKELLAWYLQEAPDKIIITRNLFGKPSVSFPIHFNVSHTQHAFSIALTDVTPIGIDIEEIDPCFEEQMKEALSLEKHEISSFALFRYWTRLEALGKATGRGLDVNFCNAELLKEENTCKINGRKEERWNMISFLYLLKSEPIICSIAYRGAALQLTMPTTPERLCS